MNKVRLSGILLGAGASYDSGMPLQVELTKELTTWLTPQKLKCLNDNWRNQGGGYSDTTIDDATKILQDKRVTYEHIIGYLEVQTKRIRERSNEYHGLRAFLSEIIYYLLKEKHVLNETFILRSMRYFAGLESLLETNTPLWVFSLNHDLVMECFAAHNRIPVRYGFSDDLVHLPRRGADGSEIGEIEASVTLSGQLRKHALNFFTLGEKGINLLKLHGSLDEFAFQDGQDLLKLLPSDNSVRGVLSVLRAANDEVRYVDPRWPGGVPRPPNEIIYADAEGEMQFLRRTPLAGAFKFQRQSNQNVPMELLTYFASALGKLATLTCIGYGFGDQHVNQAIRDWLERRDDRRLTIVDPALERAPTMLLHLTPQIELVNSKATDYLDAIAGISRTRREVIERQFATLLREEDREKVKFLLQQYLEDRTGDIVGRMVDWLKSLPWRDGSIDLEEMGLTMDEFLTISRERVPVPSPDDALEQFLRQATSPE